MSRMPIEDFIRLSAVIFADLRRLLVKIAEAAFAAEIYRPASDALLSHHIEPILIAPIMIYLFIASAPP